MEGNLGSAAIDGITVGQLSGYLKAHWLTLREQLLNRTYKPQLLRRLEIEKPDGEERRLGIPIGISRLDLKLRFAIVGLALLFLVLLVPTRDFHEALSPGSIVTFVSVVGCAGPLARLRILSHQERNWVAHEHFFFRPTVSSCSRV